MTAPQLASRVMRARRESACPACRGPVHVGNQIACSGGRWLHLRCLASARQRDKDDPVAQPFTIRSATGRELITVRQAGTALTLAVRGADPVTIGPGDARGLAAALTRRSPITGPRRPETPGEHDTDQPASVRRGAAQEGTI